MGVLPCHHEGRRRARRTRAGEKTGGETHGVGWGARNFHGGNGNGPPKKAGEQTDYGDQHPWTPEVFKTVAPPGGTEYESRQCVVLGAGAMAAQKNPQDEPAKTAVVSAAQSIRAQQLTQSLQCKEALGPMPPFVHPVEGELHAI